MSLGAAVSQRILVSMRKSDSCNLNYRRAGPQHPTNIIIETFSVRSDLAHLASLPWTD
jgi:hypothetical protein